MKPFTVIILALYALSAAAQDKPEMSTTTAGSGIQRLVTGDHMLAYTDEADPPFDADGRPLVGALQWWLDCIKQLDEASLRSSTPTPASFELPDSCPPLMTTRWGQEAPYNYMCPEPDYAPWGGYLPDAQHCPTGCVATATAQIMNYYRHPEHGKGQHSVNPEQLSGTTVYTVDFGEATYDWDLMLDDYSGDYTEESARAVAQLCYHVGVASNMGYMADASNTDNQYALNALGEFFGYDNAAMQNIQRDDYTEEEWMRMVYTELSEGHPILYEALGIDLQTYGIYGHSFVIDGYDAQGLVHVNWGWNGRYNGYYDIALLDPSNLHFDAFQMMAIGIRPSANLDPDAISAPHANPTSVAVYTLDGRMVSNAQGSRLTPGVYVSQGRKIMIR